MSTELYEGDNVTLTRFAGPAADGPDRRRWQFTTRDGWIQLDREGLTDLAVAVVVAMRDDERGLHAPAAVRAT